MNWAFFPKLHILPTFLKFVEKIEIFEIRTANV